MAMEVRAPSKGHKKGRAHPEMNVTPLVDVVLVLLIIFMVLTAALDEKFWLNVPAKAKEEQVEPEDLDESELPLVVTVNAKGIIQINRDMYRDSDFPERLRRMLIARAERRIYFDADDSVPFERAAQVLDLARGGGAAHIAVMTEKLE